MPLFLHLLVIGRVYIFQIIENKLSNLPHILFVSGNIAGQMGKHAIGTAVLVGIISQSQSKTLSDKRFENSKEREQMSEQVVSRVFPAMKFIKEHISKDHDCIKRSE